MVNDEVAQWLNGEVAQWLNGEVAQWLRRLTANRKISSSIPAMPIAHRANGESYLKPMQL